MGLLNIIQVHSLTPSLSLLTHPLTLSFSLSPPLSLPPPSLSLSPSSLSPAPALTTIYTCQSRRFEDQFGWMHVCTLPLLCESSQRQRRSAAGKREREREREVKRKSFVSYFPIARSLSSFVRQTLASCMLAPSKSLSLSLHSLFLSLHSLSLSKLPSQYFTSLPLSSSLSLSLFPSLSSIPLSPPLNLSPPQGALPIHYAAKGNNTNAIKYFVSQGKGTPLSHTHTFSYTLSPLIFLS